MWHICVLSISREEGGGAGDLDTSNSSYVMRAYPWNSNGELPPRNASAQPCALPGKAGD